MAERSSTQKAINTRNIASYKHSKDMHSAEDNFKRAFNSPQHKTKLIPSCLKKGSDSILKLSEKKPSNATFGFNLKNPNHHSSSNVSEVFSRNLLLSQLQNPKMQNSNISNFFLHQANQTHKSKEGGDSKRVFWDKRTVEKVWTKLKEVRQKVKLKKDKDYNMIQRAIMSDEDGFVLELMCDKSFKAFYRSQDNLFPKDVFLETIIQQRKFRLLTQILIDPAYEFNNNYVFQYFYSILIEEKEEEGEDSKGKDLSSKTHSINSKPCSYKKRSGLLAKTANINQAIQKDIIHNIIKSGLYDKSDENKVKIIGWFVAAFNFVDTFALLVSKQKSFFENESIQFNNFKSEEDITTFGKDSGQFQKTIENCLKCNYENLAIALSEWNDLKHECGNIPNIGAETGNMEFLKYLYEKSEDLSEALNSKRRKMSKPKSRSSYKMNLFKTDDWFQPNFAINPVIKIISKSEDNPMKNANLNKILAWENVDKDKTFVDSLFQYKCYDQISQLISLYPPERFSQAEYFRQVIESFQTELILFFLKKRECRHILIEHNLQDFIVKEYMPYGDRLYYGAEMLVYIYKNQWDGNLTKELCKNIMKAIKTKDILNCHSSILTCLLLIEFLTEVKQIAISNVSRCEKVINELNEYCKNIQESNPQESYISYLMKQKDTRERSAFQIISENSIYSLLETPEVGTIVKKMWDGTMSNNGFLAASSLHRFLFDPNKNLNPFLAFDTMDPNKVYYFQLHVWLDSSSLRFNPVGISTIILAVIFNVFIYLLTLNGELMNNFSELTDTNKTLLKIYIIWVSFLVIDIAFQIIFCIKSKRPFNLGVLQFFDMGLFVLAWLILLDTKKIFREYEVVELHKSIHNALWALELPFTKELATEVSYYTTHLAFIIRATILSFNDLFVWGRVTGVLLTYKQMGPVMRMIFAMAMLLIRYIVIIALFLACCAGVFTAIFNRFSSQFVDFSTSIISLFGGFLNNFNLLGFEEAYVGFGSVIFIAYVCVAGVLLINLLIAVLSNVYENLAKVVDASHRAVLIEYYRRYKWDKQYGYLLFLTPPINIINIPIMFLNTLACCCNQKTFNIMVTRVYFLLFYFPFIILSYTVYTLLILPFCYIKGIILTISYQSSLKILTVLKVFNFFKWFFGGLFYLLFIQIKDVIYTFIHLFKTIEAKGDEYKRVRKNVSNQDVIIFLKFIHSKIALTSKKDIHSLFMAYLDFEAAEKAQLNETARKAKEYISKIDKVSSKNNSFIETNKVMLYNNIEGNNNSSAVYTAYIRKNLMIIEILENFVIDDELGGTYVDIEKMRKLLPLTMSIKNYHLRRLINSDIHALSLAMNKLKASKLPFLQYQLMNKIMASAQRLDKNIDVEVMRVQRFSGSSGEVKTNHQDENEQAKKVRLQKEDIEQMKKYETLVRTIHSNVNDILISKKPISERSRSSINESRMSSLVKTTQIVNSPIIVNKQK